MTLEHPILFKSLCHVDGRWVHGGATIAVQNPADQSVIGHVPMLDAAQIEAAVEASERALGPGRGLPQKERSVLLLRWHGLILPHQHDLAHILALKQGKPLAEARSEIVYAASFVEWFANE